MPFTYTFTATGNEQFLTIGNFDTVSDWTLAASPQLPVTLVGNPGSFEPPGQGVFASFRARRYITDITLVEDTTQAIINLGPFSLGRDTTLCAGDSLRLSAPPHYFAYRWNTGDTTRIITARAPGTYWCWADYGCTGYTDTLRILPPPTLAPLVQNPQTVCAEALPFTLFVQPPPGVRLRWSTGDTTATATLPSPGTYWLAQQDRHCPQNARTDTFRLAERFPPLPAGLIPDSVSLCLADRYWSTAWVRLPGGGDTLGYRIRWADGYTGANPRPFTRPGIHTITLSNDCRAGTDTVRITDCPPGTEGVLFLPNAFSPNGDGLNDRFCICPWPSGISNVSLRVYDRWGGVVAIIRGPGDAWDGTGRDGGVYHYLLQYTDVRGERKQRAGQVTLLR